MSEEKKQEKNVEEDILDEEDKEEEKKEDKKKESKVKKVAKKGYDVAKKELEDDRLFYTLAKSLIFLLVAAGLFYCAQLLWALVFAILSIFSFFRS